MKIEKLPSGSYRIRKMFEGNMYTVVTDYKPTQKEAISLMAEELQKARVTSGRTTFQTAAERYISSKENVLSPTTVREYIGTLNRLSEDFRMLHINKISQLDIQLEINRLSQNLSPKTVRNYHGFISSVLAVFRPDMKISTTLPQKMKSEPYVPSDEDVRRILEYISGTVYEAPVLLACYGMRRSEICALELSDIEGDIIHINKALVMDKDKKWVVKSTKTTESTRDIIVPQKIIDLIRKQGYIYKGHPNSITCYLAKIEKELNIPHFSIHKLRHYFASKLSAMNVPEADIMSLGGWGTDYVMKNIYRHSMKNEHQKIQRSAADKLSKAILS